MLKVVTNAVAAQAKGNQLKKISPIVDEGSWEGAIPNQNHFLLQFAARIEFRADLIIEV